jgi:D-serine deaminase-like pyridoxal phosphate-dependent protein
VFNDEQYLIYSQAVSGLHLPLAFVDLDAFDANVEYVRKIAKNADRKIRVGTKSICCEPLLKRIFELGRDSFLGLMTFTAEETA